mgnify:CR=1 FL=1
MSTLETWLDFRAGENPKPCKLVCCDCGKAAQGKVSCEDGDLCDACHAEDMKDEPSV